MSDQTSKSRERFLTDSSAVPEGAWREVQVQDEQHGTWLVLTRVDGVVRGWLNVCPHAGRALNWAPDRFLVDPEGQLICAAHGAVFRPDDGLCVAGPCRGASLTPVEVIERDGRILLRPAASSRME
ncbi:MAG: Rieske (2Fe-2S) protein [Wenzhouxiangellaceae bacterium]